MNQIQGWKTVILRGIFPDFITSITTTFGRAAKASIISEYINGKGCIFSTSSLGLTISQAIASRNFPLLLAATAVMSLIVVVTNRLVGRPFYRLAPEK